MLIIDKFNLFPESKKIKHFYLSSVSQNIHQIGNTFDMIQYLQGGQKKVYDRVCRRSREYDKEKSIID